ncbi:MAG TPA: hypothetical protein VL947_01840 [Cytophagales bacterium]|nr:hypothetical protein [Cytophagales bacterium]
MNKKIILIYHLSILLVFGMSHTILGLPIDLVYKKILICTFCFVKTVFFLINVVKKEVDIFENKSYADDTQYSLILFSVFLIIISYSLDYFLLYTCDIGCFQPLLKQDNALLLFWNSFYYSSMIFFWMGIADINVSCATGQFITWAESMVTFFILSYGTFKFLRS